MNKAEFAKLSEFHENALFCSYLLEAQKEFLIIIIGEMEQPLYMKYKEDKYR